MSHILFSPILQDSEKMPDCSCEAERGLRQSQCLCSPNQKKSDYKWKSAMAGTLFGVFLLVVYVMITTSNEAKQIQDLKTTVTGLTTTYNGTREVTHFNDKRWLWFLGYAAATINFGFSLYSLATACQNFQDGASNQIQCVYGAIATASTLGGLAYRFYGTLKAVWGIAASLYQLAGGKRDLDHATIKDINAKLTEAFGKPYELHGFIHKHNKRHGHMVPDGYEAWPVFQFANHRGHHMHHVVKPLPSGAYLSRMGFAGEKNLHKRDYYDDDYFTSGGVDFTTCANPPDSDAFNEGDFYDMEDQLQIAIPDLGAESGFEFQIYDETYQGTLGSGSVSAVDPDGNTGIDDMPECPSGLPSLNDGYEYSSD